MRQTVMIVTALMIALLAVSGFIVAGSVEQMRQITEKNTLMDEMALQVKQQTERADELEAQNGDLSLYFGNFRGTVLVHLVGLVTILLFLLIRREKFHWDRTTPWYAYFGGVMGVLTVYGCNASFAAQGYPFQ